MIKIKPILLGFFMMFSVFSQERKIPLNEGWNFSQLGKNEWYSAEVPSSVQRDLIRHKILPNPYFGTNEKLIQWVEDENWHYQKKITISEEDLRNEAIFLHFEGLDTFAEVFLNGEKLFFSENMFLSHEISVKEKLKVGENTLDIHFYSPISYLAPQRRAAGFEYPAMNDHRNERVSVYARKAPYHFGWDWGIRIVQMGIWKPVWLSFYNKMRVTDFFVEQLSVSEKEAKTDNHLEIEAFENGEAEIKISVLFETEKYEKIEKIQLQQGKNTLKVPFTIENPKLWQPNGWGEAHRYDFSAEIFVNNQKIAQKTKKIGLRDLKLVRKKEKNGESFYFEINGNPLFAKGANYIPGEILTTQQDSVYYDRLFQNVRAANMNMLRVWGGGIYENDYFYELADRYGILVWQDFMFACTPYPNQTHFLKNISEEAEYQLKRLRNYASIALWCGNNEVEESIKYWGFEKQVPAHAYQNFKAAYEDIFQKILPQAVKQYAPQTAYIHSSPLVANWGRPESLAFGDAHYWGVWYGRQPFEILDTRISRFMSEFGFQAFPEMKTIRSFATERDFDIESEVMKTHQKSSTGNDAIKEYMLKYYKTPTNFEDFVYLGLVMQGEGMKKGMLAHRRNRPYCMGSLYWQLNDSWPVVSWAGIDYYNNWKALHYKTREAFAPIALDLFLNKEKNKAEIFVFSDELTPRKKQKLRIQLIDFQGKLYKEFWEELTIKPNQTQLVKSFPIPNLASAEMQKETFVKLTLFNPEGERIAQDHFFFHWANQLKLPKTNISSEIIFQNGTYFLKLKSNKLAKNVFIEVPVMGAQFSDNFFDLLPNEEKIVEITGENLPENMSIKLKSIRDTYAQE